MNKALISSVEEYRGELPVIQNIHLLNQLHSQTGNVYFLPMNLILREYYSIY